ncbi:terminase small subunit [Polaribacter phage P12002S]|uniref:Terminase small subunit n=1 Tax=Polaribacter phage P12002S TaxID=1647387 RepID=A0A0F7IJX1_9CAUD|nr:terminase small subunit [Polaribacter phage P12002S]AKG94257.1 terminase small subunit [Polaribacter phage P12002S]
MLKRSNMSKKTPTHTNKQQSTKNTGAVKVKELSEKHKYIIEEWSSNGYNKTKAVQTVCPEVGNSSAAVHVFNAIASKPSGKKYIEGVQTRLRKSTHISKEQVLQELIHGSFTDATDYIGLTTKELKELPPAARRQIQSFKETERTETDRAGNKITTKTIDIKLINKLDALKETAKIIGAYEIDNNQKKGLIDASKATDETKKALYNAMILLERDNKAS